MRSLARCCAAALWLAACAPSAAPQVHVEVQLASDDGWPLSDVPVLVDGAEVARTDERGKASATVHGTRERRVMVSVRCPDGYREAEGRSVPLDRASKATLRLDLVCVPEQRKLAIVVRAPLAAGLVVRADGAELGRIAPDGTLHAVLARPAEERVRLSIDTTSKPSLVPQQPAREIRVVDRDEIVVFDQQLTVEKPRPTKRRRPTEAARSAHIPYAIAAQAR